MILEYELALSKYVLGMFPDLDKVAWSEEWQAFLEQGSQIKFPSALIYSERDEFPLVKSIEAHGGKFFILIKRYSVKFFWEKERELIDCMTKARYFIKDNPYISFDLDGDRISIHMRTISLQMTPIRVAYDTKGALKFVDWNFQSQLVLSKNYKYTAIKEVSININANTGDKFNITYEE